MSDEFLVECMRIEEAEYEAQCLRYKDSDTTHFLDVLGQAPAMAAELKRLSGSIDLLKQRLDRAIEALKEWREVLKHRKE